MVSPQVTLYAKARVIAYRAMLDIPGKRCSSPRSCWRPSGVAAAPQGAAGALTCFWQAEPRAALVPGPHQPRRAGPRPRHLPRHRLPLPG